jgi:hypothetical protein
MKHLLKCFNSANHNDDDYCEHCSTPLYENYKKLTEENKRLREALEVYSDERNWEADTWYRFKGFSGKEIAEKALQK